MTVVEYPKVSIISSSHLFIVNPPSLRLRSAIDGLLRLFTLKMRSTPPAFAARIYEALLAQLLSHVAAMKRNKENPKANSGIYTIAGGGSRG